MWGKQDLWGMSRTDARSLVAGAPAAPLTLDGTALRGVPASAAEWAYVRSQAGVTAGAVRSIWGMQELSGNLADGVGGKTLTAFSTPQYNQTIAGWSRKAIRLDGTGDAFYSLDSGIGNTATTSHLVFALVALAASQASDLPLINVGLGAANADRRQLFINNPTNSISVRGDGGQAAVDGAVDLGVTVHPVWFMINRANSTLVAITDNEVVSAALTLPSSGTNAYFSFEGNNNTFLLYAALFDGAAAELTASDLLAMNVAMGWSSAWAVDALATKAVPANATQWNALRAARGLAASNPNGLWLMQDVSGGAAAAIGAIPLVEEGARIDYQQTIANWTRKAITSRGDALFTTSASLPDPATTSFMVMAYAVCEPAAVTSDRVYVGLTNRAILQVTATPVVRVVNSTNIANGAATITAGVRPLILRFDQTANTVTVYSDQEKVTVAQIVDPNKAIVFVGSPTPGVTQVLYGAYWSGAAAEIDDNAVKAMMQALGWTVLW